MIRIPALPVYLAVVMIEDTTMAMGVEATAIDIAKAGMENVLGGLEKDESDLKSL